ncbi:hypothetical protein C8Q77DRAFT_1161939 [Trametes polyzona]|nr:hypothetical protein C8Q77DRAFT_1161939 [Trametes polyzona]
MTAANFMIRFHIGRSGLMVAVRTGLLCGMEHTKGVLAEVGELNIYAMRHALQDSSVSSFPYYPPPTKVEI